jgi:hypothetical protein
VTIALQHSHPKTWMEDQRVLHYFISTVNNFQQQPTPVQAPVVAPQEEEVIEATEAFVDPNQITIFDVIAEEEAKEAEATQITYTDTVGNTFSSIDFHNEVVNNSTEDPEDEEDLNDWINLPLELDEDNVPMYIPDENQEYTGENSSYMSLEVTPEERDKAELDIISAEEAKEYAEDAANTANFDDLIFNINDEEDDDASDFF